MGENVDNDQVVDYFKELKEIVKPGQRACISIPVVSYFGKFSHAMNIVNMGPVAGGAEDQVFVICGQSGRVFDLLDEKDVAYFKELYVCDSPAVKYALAPENSDSLYAEVKKMRMEKNLINQLLPLVA